MLDVGKTRKNLADNEKLKKNILTTCSSLLCISLLTYFLFYRGDMLSNYAGQKDRFLHPLRL